MSKLRLAILAATLAATAGGGAAHGAILGPGAATCVEGRRPAMLVRIVGLKARTGSLRVQSYGGDPAHFFDKGSYIERIDVRIPPAGPVEVCVPVPGPGTYAVSVRHDVNGSGRNDMSDGGGFSGNPAYSLMDVLAKRKPDAATVSVRVGGGVTAVPVTLKYVVGFGLRAVKDGTS